MSETPDANLLGLTARIIEAHIVHNQVTAEALPAMIKAVYRSLATAGNAEVASVETQILTGPIKRSVFPDFIICLEDGLKLKMLKRHLNTSFGMTPADYRAKWSLPHDYPMVAPQYAATRSSLAKKIGLGRKRPVAVSVPEATPSADPKVTIVPARRARGSRG